MKQFINWIEILHYSLSYANCLLYVNTIVYVCPLQHRKSNLIILMTHYSYIMNHGQLIFLPVPMNKSINYRFVYYNPHIFNNLDASLANSNRVYFILLIKDTISYLITDNNMKNIQWQSKSASNLIIIIITL